MLVDQFFEEDFILEEDWEELKKTSGPDSILLAGEMRDLICEGVPEFDRNFVYSRLLEMGAFFPSARFFPLMLYFDSLYKLNEE